MLNIPEAGPGQKKTHGSLGGDTWVSENSEIVLRSAKLYRKTCTHAAAMLLRQMQQAKCAFGYVFMDSSVKPISCRVKRDSHMGIDVLRIR